MNFNKIFRILFLFLGVSIQTLEPQELLTQFREMATYERKKEIERLQAEYKQQQEEDNRYSAEAWRHEKPHLERKKCMLKNIEDWGKRDRLDHIKIIYLDSEGTWHIQYLQLENSKYNPLAIGSGFIYSLFFKTRNYSYDEKDIEDLLKTLAATLPFEKKPDVTVYKSKKFREEKGKIFTSTKCDLYSVCINYSESEIPYYYGHRNLIIDRRLHVDWSKK